MSNFPKHLLDARYPSTVRENQKVFTQVVNISPDSVKLYKDMRICEFTPWQHVHVIEELQELDITPRTPDKIDVHLSQCELSNSEKGQLAELINEFGDLFISSQGELWCTSIGKHEIVTEGSPIRQPVRHVSVALQDVVDSEVKKCSDLELWSCQTKPLSIVVSYYDGA